MVFLWNEIKEKTLTYKGRKLNIKGGQFALRWWPLGIREFKLGFLHLLFWKWKVVLGLRNRRAGGCCKCLCSLSGRGKMSGKIFKHYVAAKNELSLQYLP